MANITLTTQCNLRCPYCFAHEFVDGEANVITMENFHKAVDFVTSRGPAHIGLIGGEPTLHPQFKEILQSIIDDPRISGATLFTNGIALKPYRELLSHPKFSMLVNTNSPEFLGEHRFEKIKENLDALVFEYGMQHRINLGLNIYDDAQDYQYILELLQRYSFTRLRISVTVPSFPEGCGTDVLKRFREVKPYLLQLFKDMDEIGVLPYYDCNRPPQCIWTPEEHEWLDELVARHPYDALESSPNCADSFCRPTIDILPTLEAIRCFALSEMEKVSIADFESEDDLVVHFMRCIDRPAFRVFASEECENCYLRRQWRCCQGCIGYKMDKILAMPQK